MGMIGGIQPVGAIIEKQVITDFYHPLMNQFGVAIFLNQY